MGRLSPCIVVFISTFCFFLIIPLEMTFAQMVEICDNGIDDDNDGLIDLNDDDCICPIELPISLIPNPSFEEMDCCPSSESQLNCAVSWQQASAATTDYMHTCNNFISHPLFSGSVPLPMPDGEGCIGFRNGKPSSPNFKEYTGTCLIEPLESGTFYTLNMWVGFMNSQSSPAFELTIFGAEDCVNGTLPFGGNNPNIGCPLNVDGYEQLGSIMVSGQNEWVNIEVSFRPSREMDVIVIGANCTPNPNNHYYFFDNLVLQKTVEFGEQPEIIGHPCMNNVELVLPLLDGETYQWYKDGIAIPNAISANFEIPEEQIDVADFQLMVTTDAVCKLSAPYTFEIPTFETMRSITICDNEPIQLNDQSVIQEGEYSELLVSSQGCDSTVITEVSINLSYDVFFSDTICAKEQYMLGEQILELPGIYTEFFQTVQDCDSIVTVELTVLPSLVSVDAQGDKTIRLGQQTPIQGVVSDLSLLEVLEWSSSDSHTAICDSCLYQLVSPKTTTTYTLKGIDIRGCDVSDNVVIKVDQYYEAYIPNAFSPNGDGVNDYFYIHGTTNIAQINLFEIYDRWGTKVYKDVNLLPNDEVNGWDGFFRGEGANLGIYTYYAEIEFADGQIEAFKGDFVLLR